MAEHAVRLRLLPIAALFCVGSCLSTEGYYRNQDAGASGSAGTGGVTGKGGTSGSAGAGVTGTAGATGTGGVAGSLATGRGGSSGSTGSAGSTGAGGRGGTTGAAGRGGTTGSAGATGSGGSGAVLFSETFDPMTGAWDWAFNLTHMVMADGAQMNVVTMSEAAGDQAIAAVGSPNWTNYSVEAKVKVTSFAGTSSSDGVAICARLNGTDSFYYLLLSGSSDTKGLKIKLNNGSNTSLSSSLDSTGFALNTWVTLRLDVQGNTLTAYLNGTPRGTPYVAVDADKILPMGGIGLMVVRATAEFDDIVVRALP